MEKREYQKERERDRESVYVREIEKVKDNHESQQGHKNPKNFKISNKRTLVGVDFLGILILIDVLQKSLQIVLIVLLQNTNIT